MRDVNAIDDAPRAKCFNGTRLMKLSGRRPEKRCRLLTRKVEPKPDDDADESELTPMQRICKQTTREPCQGEKITRANRGLALVCNRF